VSSSRHVSWSTSSSSTYA